MLLWFWIFSITAKYITWKRVNWRGWTLLNIVSCCWTRIAYTWLTGSIFPAACSNTDTFTSRQLLICGYPRDSSYKVCVYLLLLSQDMICCSQCRPPFVCKCVTLKITTLSIARKREKNSKTVEKSPGLLPTTCLGSSSSVESGWGWA